MMTTATRETTETLKADAKTKADEGGITEEDWKRIDELLHRSWRSLHQAVNP
jgi:hypothetical protein